MQHGWTSSVVDRIAGIRRNPSVQNILTVTLVVAGPILVLFTYLALQPIAGDAGFLRLILTLDFVYVLVVATLVVGRVFQVVSALRSHSVGSRLHLRLTAVFGVLALVPTVLVALFAMLTVNQALEGWFSERVRGAVGASLSAAQAYQSEQRIALQTDLQLLANVLNRRQRAIRMEPGEIRQELAALQPRIQRGLKELYIIDNLGNIRVRGPDSYLFNFEKPTADQIEQSDTDMPIVIEDLVNNEFRALVRLQGFSNHYLYAARSVDGDLINLLGEAAETASVYQQLERDRGRLLFDFGLLYLAFALILILAATWVGLWFAERLARPIGNLAAAAKRVGAGDLDARVENLRGDDEIAMLGRYFNQMTHQLKGQRDTLIASAEQSERRRRLFDSVLSSVTSGVIGLSTQGDITFVNTSALRILDLGDDCFGQALSDAVPEFAALQDKLKQGVKEVVQGEIKVVRAGKQENLLVRIAKRKDGFDHGEGFVIAFEDVTDLVSAQRMAAWGDVARRIAHEIKNPLTPIKLSAERINRKYVPLVGDQAAALEKMTNVIVRQTDDLRHIVDEFSKFARMPQADRRPVELTPLLRDAIELQIVGQPDVRFDVDLTQQDVVCALDTTMVHQALTNLMKNAGEAIAERRSANSSVAGRIKVSLKVEHASAVISISDNGIGLPQDRAKLFEPYVTHRDEGTGLGLPIVQKIIEEHGGTIELRDAEIWDDSGITGAKAIVTLPILAQEDLK